MDAGAERHARRHRVVSQAERAREREERGGAAVVADAVLRVDAPRSVAIRFARTSMYENQSQVQLTGLPAGKRLHRAANQKRLER